MGRSRTQSRKRNTRHQQRKTKQQRRGSGGHRYMVKWFEQPSVVDGYQLIEYGSQFDSNSAATTFIDELRRKRNVSLLSIKLIDQWKNNIVIPYE